MEHRKDCAGPREWMDDSMLRQILSDMAGPDNGNRGQCSNGNTLCGCGKTKQRQRQENISQDISENECCIAGAGIPTLAGLPVVMAYVPNQAWEGLLEPEEALAVGTLFTGLQFPWYPSRCRKTGCGRCQA